MPSGLRIGFPEAEEARTQEAIRQLLEDAKIRPVAIGLPDALAALPLGAVEMCSTADADDPELGGDPLGWGGVLLARGELDGVVAGAATSTAAVLRAGLKRVGTAAEFETVSSAFYLALREPTPGRQRILTFTDPAVVPRPTSAQLAEAAAAACDARRRIVGDQPRVAFLSYSTVGSAGGAEVEKVREALERFRERCPAIPAAGELQADAALVPEIARRKMPGHAIEGDANILVFPDLDAANIAYKLVERLASAFALGPILQGLAAPLNDLSRGAEPRDIVGVAYITALMASATSANRS